VLGDAELVGFTAPHLGFGSIGLAEIVAGHEMTGPISFGPVRYVDVEVGDGRVVQCVESALLLAVHEQAPVALVLSRGGDLPMRPSSLRLEGVSPVPGAVSGLLRELRAAMREHNVFPRPDHLPASRPAGRQRRGPVPHDTRGHADRRDPSRGDA
jgi:hypothetical protein